MTLELALISDMKGRSVFPLVLLIIIVLFFSLIKVSSESEHKVTFLMLTGRHAHLLLKSAPCISNSLLPLLPLQEDVHPPETEKEEPLLAPVVEEVQKSSDNFQERRALAIAAKAQEIEKVLSQLWFLTL